MSHVWGDSRRIKVFVFVRPSHNLSFVVYLFNQRLGIEAIL